MTRKKNKAAVGETLQLQKVTPAIPTDLKKNRVLQNLLEVMECSGLLGKPWAFQNEAIVAELEGTPPNHCTGIRAHPEKWTMKQ